MPRPAPALKPWAPRIPHSNRASFGRGQCGAVLAWWKPRSDSLSTHRDRASDAKGFQRVRGSSPMVMDLSAQLMQATVQLEQPLGDGTRTVGTGFLITEITPDGRPHTILVTANHVFDKMPGANARVGYRIANPDGSWSYSPQSLKIRDAQGHALWTHHPSRDVAAIPITAPEAFAKAAIPEDYLAADDTFSKYQVGAGDQMMTLGFPRGLAANSAGFPILRAGRVASYPIAPAKIFPTFLLDFSVFPGNSGGPVFMSGPARHAMDANGQGGQDVEF